MNRVDAAVHIEMVGTQAVRFFRSPRFAKTGHPDMPWHSCDDLWAALDIGSEARASIMRRLRADWIDPVTVATPDGIVVISPYVAGDVMIGEWLRLHGIEEGDTGDDSLGKRQIMGAFRRGNTSALKAMTRHLDGRAKLAFCLAAMDSIDDLCERD